MCMYGLVRLGVGLLVSGVVGGVTFTSVLDKMGYNKPQKNLLEDISDAEIEPEEYED